MSEYDENVSFHRRLSKDIETHRNSSVPELRIYTFFDRPLGPHPIAMFEVNIFTPAQFGAFIPWLVIHRGPLSALLHPNTTDDEFEIRNHSQRATWLGEKVPLNLGMLAERQRKIEAERREKEKEAQ